MEYIFCGRDTKQFSQTFISVFLFCFASDTLDLNLSIVTLHGRAKLENFFSIMKQNGQVVIMKMVIFF